MPELRDAAILVTGATGFVGAALTAGLLAAGVRPERLRCLVRDRARARAQGLPGRSLVEGDVTAPGSLRAAVAGAELVFHVAGTLKASRRSDYAAVNAEGTRHLVAAAQATAPRCHLVLVSSLAAAGPSVDGAGTDAPPDACQPVSAYGESKRQGELAVVRSGLPHTVVRPPVVYGRGDVATRLLFRQAQAPLCAVPSRPRPLSVIHVEDVVRALLLAGAAAASGAILPLDGPERTDTHALLRAFAAAAGGRARLLPVPLPLAAAAAQVSDLFASLTGRASFFNGDKIREVRACGWVADGRPALDRLGFAPGVALADGLAAVARAEGFVRRRGAAADAARAG